MIKIILGFVLGILFLWFVSKYYCFRNSKEWILFVRRYFRK